MRKISLFSIVLMLGLAVLGLPACSSPEEIDTTVSVTSVSLNPAELILTVGYTGNLTPTVLPENATNRNVTWGSNNEAVATVNTQGVVNAVSPGTATITVTTVDGRRTAMANVTVNAVVPPTVAVTGVTLSEETLSLVVGDTETLIANVLPAGATNPNVTWHSDDESVATVDDDGEVTAVSEGTAIITVRTVDGNFTADVEITVTPAPVLVTSVQIDRTRLFLTLGGESVTVSAFVFPRYATNQNVSWEIADANIATVDDDGVVTAVAVGETTITVTAECGGYTDTIPVEVEPVTIPVTGVTLNRNTVELAVGGTTTLIHTIAPADATNQNVKWISMDPSIANVDQNGVVTAIWSGTTFIYVSTDDGYFYDRAEITVIIPVTGVTLNRNALTLTVGSDADLWANVEPFYATNRNVTWATSNPAVASIVVDAHGTVLVTAVAVGTTTITATTECEGLTAMASVEVIDITDVGVVIDGIRWATRNVSVPGSFAPNPESAGMFYQWNRRIGWSSTDPMINSDGGTTWNHRSEAGTEWATSNDPCPTGWRVPTRAELQSLDSVGSIWTARNGVNGRLFGTAPNQIFLPAAGWRFGGTLQNTEFGFYWSSINDGGSENPSLFVFHSGDAAITSGVAHQAGSIRCVAK